MPAALGRRHRHVARNRQALRRDHRRAGRRDPQVEGIALGRAETPDDVAALAYHLAGPKSGYMTGQAVLIDGSIVYR